MSEKNPRVTEQGAAALQEFGFELVPVHQVGAPTPGRIADRLNDCVEKLEQKYRNRSFPGIAEGIADLRRLLLALDTWDTGMRDMGAPGSGTRLGKGVPKTDQQE